MNYGRCTQSIIPLGAVWQVWFGRRKMETYIYDMYYKQEKFLLKNISIEIKIWSEWLSTLNYKYKINWAGVVRIISALSKLPLNALINELIL